jgi:alpha-ketoglutarate-dependent taurine dioxygenase
MIEIKTRFLAPAPAPELPLVIEPDACSTNGGAGPRALAEWLTKRRSWLREKLDRHGGVLFRGFLLRTDEDFATVSAAISPHPLDYTRGITPRTKLRHGVYTATDLPPRYRIFPHCEMSYSVSYPKTIAFFCHTPAPIGGQTPIVDVRRIADRIKCAVRTRFAEKGITIIQNVERVPSFTCRTPWPVMFQTSKKASVERTCRDLLIDFRWKPNDVLHLRMKRPALIAHPRTGETVWFNHAASLHNGRYARTFWKDRRYAAWAPVKLFELYQSATKSPDDYFNHCLYGDETKIDGADIDHIRDVLLRESVLFTWEQGDLLLLDNILVAHGRMPYRGPRKILVSMHAE